MLVLFGVPLLMLLKEMFPARLKETLAGILMVVEKTQPMTSHGLKHPDINLSATVDSNHPMLLLPATRPILVLSVLPLPTLLMVIFLARLQETTAGILTEVKSTQPMTSPGSETKLVTQ
jgi:hypothetical protein